MGDKYVKIFCNSCGWIIALIVIINTRFLIDFDIRPMDKIVYHVAVLKKYRINSSLGCSTRPKSVLESLIQLMFFSPGHPTAIIQPSVGDTIALFRASAQFLLSMYISQRDAPTKLNSTVKRSEGLLLLLTVKTPDPLVKMSESVTPGNGRTRVSGTNNFGHSNWRVPGWG